ncbi:polysaccharide biosynthesis/export family protein [Petrotoga sp. DB-2]
MKKGHFIVVLLFLLVLPIITFSYNVRMGDTLGIWVLGYPEYSITDAVVGPEGDITVPPIGRIKAEGRTLEEIENEISNKMESYIKTNKVTVGITQYAPFSVTVLGNTNINGVIDIKNEKIKLSDLIGLAGGIKDITKSSYALIKSPDGKEQKVNIAWIKSGEAGEDPYIYENYFVLFPYDYTNKVTVFSDFGTSSLDYYEGLTLKTVISSMNIPTNKIPTKIMIVREAEIQEVPFDEIVKKEDYSLQPGDTVIIPYNYTNNVLVFSDFGSATLDYFEGMGIKSVITMISSGSDINLPLNQVNDEITVVRGEQTYKVSLQKITQGSDFLLQPGDTVIINKFENYVYVSSQEISKRIDFEKQERMNIRTLLTKVGISEENVEKIRVNNQPVNSNAELKKGDFVQITLKRNYVYLSGAFNTTGKVEFLPNEEISMDKIVGLAGGFSSNFSGNLVIVDNSGSTKSLTVDPNNLTMLKDIILSSGSTIIADTELRMAYIFGEVSDVIEYNQGESLYELLLPLNLDESYQVRYQIGEKMGTLTANEFDSLKNIPLEGKVFVEISKIAPDQVIVYKAGETQIIQQKNVRLIDIFSSVNGFSPVDTGTITIYQNNEAIKTINSEELLNNLMMEVPKGSYVVVQPEVSGSYIAVLGNIPSPKSLRTDVPMSLVEILSNSAIDWKNQESIFIYTKNNEEIKVDIKDVESLRNVLVNPGSIVYVPPAEEQVVYVFGEVAEPGIISYNAGMTVLDAVLKAGNASKSAQLTTVYLFKDGPENPPVTLDLSGIINAAPVKTGMNPEVKPKDIIYIPKNTLTNIVEVMSTVQTFMNFIKTGAETYTSVSGLF